MKMCMMNIVRPREWDVLCLGQGDNMQETKAGLSAVSGKWLGKTGEKKGCSKDPSF